MSDKIYCVQVVGVFDVTTHMLCEPFSSFVTHALPLHRVSVHITTRIAFINRLQVSV